MPPASPLHGRHAVLCRTCGAHPRPNAQYQGNIGQPSIFTLCADCARADADRQVLEVVINTARLIVRAHHRMLDRAEARPC